MSYALTYRLQEEVSVKDIHKFMKAAYLKGNKIFLANREAHLIVKKQRKSFWNRNKEPVVIFKGHTQLKTGTPFSHFPQA